MEADDKEVGRLWGCSGPFDDDQAVKFLIRKLVNERRLRICYPNIHGTDGWAEACAEYGISVRKFKRAFRREIKRELQRRFNK